MLDGDAYRFGYTKILRDLSQPDFRYDWGPAGMPTDGDREDHCGVAGAMSGDVS